MAKKYRVHYNCVIEFGNYKEFRRASKIIDCLNDDYLTAAVEVLKIFNQIKPSSKNQLSELIDTFGISLAEVTGFEFIPISIKQIDLSEQDLYELLIAFRLPGNIENDFGDLLAYIYDHFQIFARNNDLYDLKAHVVKSPSHYNNARCFLIECKAPKKFCAENDSEHFGFFHDLAWSVVLNGVCFDVLGPESNYRREFMYTISEDSIDPPSFGWSQSEDSINHYKRQLDIV